MRFAWLALTLIAAAITLGCSTPAPVAPPEGTKAGPYSREELKKRLTPEQYDVCVFKGTEARFANKYWDHKGDGVYHCVVCDQALFDSATKFDSGTGWPSYYDVLTQGKVKTEEDRSLGVLRTEVLCSECGSHLGHLFDDGPAPTGQRYCINSAALDFRPREPKKTGAEAKGPEKSEPAKE